MAIKRAKSLQKVKKPGYLAPLLILLVLAWPLVVWGMVAVKGLRGGFVSSSTLFGGLSRSLGYTPSLVVIGCIAGVPLLWIAVNMVRRELIDDRANKALQQHLANQQANAAESQQD